jgi:NADPH2:quinone reductase
VAFAANIADDVEMLRLGGSIATYATDVPALTIPFWPMVFKNVGLSFVGTDDVPGDAKAEAARALNAALTAGWDGLPIEVVVPLADIAVAHEHVERRQTHGRIIVST